MRTYTTVSLKTRKNCKAILKRDEAKRSRGDLEGRGKETKKNCEAIHKRRSNESCSFFFLKNKTCNINMIIRKSNYRKIFNNNA